MPPLNDLQKAFIKNILVPTTSVIDAETGVPVDWSALGGSVDGIEDVPGLTDALAAKATQDDIDTALSSLVDAAPGALDTLNELAAALGDDANFAGSLTTSLAGKADTAHDHTATPALTLGTANAKGSASTVIATDATIVAFDATAPSTQAFGDAAAAGAAAVAARRDHKHAMPASPIPAPVAAGSVLRVLGPVDLTTGKSAWAFSTNGSHVAGSAIDDDPATYWQPTDRSSYYTQWQVDLGSDQTVGAFHAVVGSYVPGYIIRSAPSASPSTWTTRYTGANIVDDTGVLSFAPAAARYWSFYPTDFCDTAPVLYEFELFAGGLVWTELPVGAAGEIIKAVAGAPDWEPEFDATAPSTQAFGDAAAVGTATVAARRDHKHAMPASPSGGSVTDDVDAAASLFNYANFR